MITCDECGKRVGGAVVGTSWICEDCRVGEPPKAGGSEAGAGPKGTGKEGRPC